jgi:hypothetical protein
MTAAHVAAEEYLSKLTADEASVEKVVRDTPGPDDNRSRASRRWMVTELTSARTMSGPRTWNQLRDHRQSRRLGTSKT